MVSPRPCRTPRPPRRARCTWVRPSWPRLTKRASRSARKASGLTQEGGGGDPAALFCVVFGKERANSLKLWRFLKRPPCRASSRNWPLHLELQSSSPCEGTIPALMDARNRRVHAVARPCCRIYFQRGRLNEPQGFYAYRSEEH